MLGLARQMDMRTHHYSGNIERAKEVIALVSTLSKCWQQCRVITP